MIDRVLTATVRVDFTTHEISGALVAPSSAFDSSDFRIYKDGSAAQKTTTNGITVTSPFDSIVGKHLIEIDTSNSTGDVGFWAAGSEYRVELNSAKTVDGIVQSGVVLSRFRLIVAEAATPADVNAQVLDVLQTDTFAELAAVPAATSSLKDKLTWTFQWLRNKSTQTATQRKLYADDGTTVVSTETVSDDLTTYTKGEAS